MSKEIELISSVIIAESGVSFGTSGARGLVTQFTAEVCAAFTSGFIAVMKKKYNFETIAIAIDNRPSSYAMAKACAQAIKHLKLNVVYYGVIPTPALAYAAQSEGIPAIMVTGSHIPFDRNGLKFYRPDGEISKLDEQSIIHERVNFLHALQPLELVIDGDATDKYITRYTSLFDSQWLTGKRIGVYEHSSAGRDIYYKIFEGLGAEVVPLGRSNHFIPIDTEAVSEEDQLKAIEWSKEFDLDMIFSTDGDGDRPLVSDENGNWLRGDILGLLSAKALCIDALAIPVSCNTAIEACDKFKHIERTMIGSPYVIAEFEGLAKKFSSVAGFEANGGFLLGSDVLLNDQLLKALPTRDAVLPAIMLLAEAGDVVISKIVNTLPQRYTYSDRVQNFATNKSLAIIAEGKNDIIALLKKIGFDNVKIKSVDGKDGMRITLLDGRIIHLRPSGNAPELRCYAEAGTYIQAKDTVVTVLKNLQKIYS